ncbi:MAG TPA: ABC transporter permease, partial [Pyrinomonadaceae bacterium]
MGDRRSPWQWLIAFIGVIVPSRLRVDWRQEWEAELRYRETLLAEWNQLNWRTKVNLLWHSLGALLDALWLQPRRWEDEVIQDLRFGVRMLLKHKSFTIVAILSLALGIGANTAIFSVVNSLLLRELPFRNPDQLMSVSSRRTDREDAPFTIPDFIDYRDQNQTLEQIAAFANIGVSLSGGEKTERLQGVRVSGNLFQLLGVDAGAGRTLFSEDDEPGRRHVVVLTHECWRARFGSDPQLIGKTLNLNGEGYVAVGILPPDFNLPVKEAEVAIPLAPDADPLRNVRTSTNFLRAIARTKTGVTRQQAESDLTSIVTRQRQQYGDVYLKKTGVRLVPLHEELVGSVRTALWVLLGAVGMVLLLACANLAALSLARASSHQREIAIRKALGASTMRIVRQILTENFILALVGGAAGLLLAIWGVRFLVALSPTGLPRQQEIGVDLRVLIFAAAASIASAAIFGILPALQGGRVKAVGELRATGRGAGVGARRNRSRSVLVIAEVAVSFILLIGAGLLIQSFMRVQAIQPGFDPTNTLALRLSLPKANYPNRDAVAEFCDRLSTKIQNLPGVEAVGAISVLPMSERRHTVDFNLVGRALSAGDAHNAQYRLATPDYFRAMNIGVLQGRQIDNHDNGNSTNVVIINETMARRFWPNANPIGERINIDDNNVGPRPVEIVGVVSNVKHISLEGDPTFDIYVPMAQVPNDGVNLITNTHYWVVRSKADSRAIETIFRRELQSIDRDVATSNVKSLEEYLGDSVAPRKFNLRVMTIFAVAALLLAVTGIYGVVSYTVTKRTPEIGIRLALGAARTNVFHLILGQGLKMVVTGVALGVLGAFAMTRVIRTLLFGITPTDTLTFVLVSLMLIVVSLIACSAPARRAT